MIAAQPCRSRCAVTSKLPLALRRRACQHPKIDAPRAAASSRRPDARCDPAHPLVVSVDGTLVPTLANRRCCASPRVHAAPLSPSDGSARTSPAVSDPARGRRRRAVLLRPPCRARSAIDVLEGRVVRDLRRPARARRPGRDRPARVPFRTRRWANAMSGTEVHARSCSRTRIEGSLLRRPRHAPRSEALLLLAAPARCSSGQRRAGGRSTPRC